MEDKARLERVRILACLILITFVILAGRLWQLQVVHGQRYAEMADGNRIRWIREPAPRGRIYDRNGVPLVTNRASFTVSLTPGGLEAEKREEVLNRLGRLLDMSSRELEAALQKGQRYPYEPIRIKQDVPAETVIALEEQRWQLPGVMVEAAEVREYPYGSLACHVLGYMAPISRELLAQWADKDYYPSDFVGWTGLERLYEEELRGEDGGRQVEVNALDRPVRVLGRVAPVPGHDLHLTLDVRLQQVAETALQEHLAYLRREGKYTETFAGVVIALDPRTGEILAMASYPGYDPNRLSDAAERGKYYAQLRGNPHRPLLNRAVKGLYSPGSAFKPLTAIAALEEGVTTPTEIFHADGIGPFGIKRDWPLRHDPPLPPHGDITIVGALRESCNDFFWEMGLRLGIDNLARYARAAGFGSPTGLCMYPEEGAGFVPDPEWKKRRFADKPRSEQVWYPVETMDVAIGQGFLLVTPLQMATFYMGLANRGKIYRPYLVRSITLPTGEVIEKQTPQVSRVIEASPRTWQTVIEGMKQVVAEGTGSSAFRDFPFDIAIAGKTGSVQLGPGQGDAHGWFGAFAPADNPEIVVIALAEHGGGGAVAGAPIVRRVLEAYFSQKQQDLTGR